MQSKASVGLTGKRILITRAAAQTATTEDLVRSRGGIPVRFPCLEVQVLLASIEEGLQHLKSADAEVLFSSRNGVESVATHCGKDFAATFQPLRVAAVGSKTAAALAAHDVTPWLVPEHASQEGLIAAYVQHGLPKTLVFFRAEEGRNILAEALTKEGCQVVTVPAYRTVCPDADATETIEAIRSGNVDAVLLGSAKTARHYIQRIGDIETANTPAIAVISPQVAAAADAAGLSVQAVAKTASFDAMLDALNAYFLSHHGESHVTA